MSVYYILLLKTYVKIKYYLGKNQKPHSMAVKIGLLNNKAWKAATRSRCVVLKDPTYTLDIQKKLDQNYTCKLSQLNSNSPSFGKMKENGNMVRIEQERKIQIPYKSESDSVNKKEIVQRINTKMN